MQGASRQHRDRELQLRAGAVTRSAAPPARIDRRSSRIAALLGAGAGPRSAPTRKAFESPTFRYGVALPSGCRHEEGPGTLDAVCSSDLDPEKSAQASAASALVLEVGAETVPADGGAAAADLAQRYGETQFKEELAEAVCGEADRAKVKIDSPKQVLEDTRVVYTAAVTCPEIKFLGLGERRAQVRFTDHARDALSRDGAGAQGRLRQAQGSRRRVLRELPHASPLGGELPMTMPRSSCFPAPTATATLRWPWRR